MRVDELQYINDKDQRLACTFFYPDKYDPNRKYETVPVGHGMGGSDQSSYIAPSIRRIVSTDRIGVSYNLRGAHPSHPDTSDLTPQNALSDIRHVMEFIANKKCVDKDKIVPINASYSGNIIAQYAASANSVAFAGIISHATAVRPMHKFEKKLKKMYGVYRRLWEWKKLYPVEIDKKKCMLPYGIYDFFSKHDLVKEAAPLIKVPFIGIHGTEDDLAPIDDMREFAAALTQSPFVRLYEIKNAPHDMRNCEKGNFLDQAIDYSHQAVDMITKQSIIVDVNNVPYELPQPANAQIKELKIA